MMDDPEFRGGHVETPPVPVGGTPTVEQLSNPYVIEIELSHFRLCLHCGQALDDRCPASLLYHSLPGHPPLRRH